MKVWKEFGSSHSGNVTIIGEFESQEKAAQAFPLIEDFTRAFWEERYPNIQAFVDAWKAREPNIPYIGLNSVDYEIGVDNDPDIQQSGSRVVVTSLRSETVSGIVKLLFHKGMKEIKISGQGA